MHRESNDSMVTMSSSDPPEQAPPPHLVTPSCVELRPSAVAEGLLGEFLAQLPTPLISRCDVLATPSHPLKWD